MYNRASSTTGKSLIFISATLLVTLTGCVGYVERPRGGNVYVAPAPRVETVFVDQEDYVYYPGYQMYYGSRSHRYYRQQGSAWVAQPAPFGISVDVLVASPSVRMDFHDAPAAHHNQVIKTYPKSWSQPGADRGRRNDQKKDSRDDKRDDKRR